VQNFRVSDTNYSCFDLKAPECYFLSYFIFLESLLETVSEISSESRTNGTSKRTFLCEYECPLRCYYDAICTAVRFQGFISSDFVLRFFTLARHILKNEEDVPWIALNVWGFIDSPISWKECRHGYLENGENDYAIIIFPNGKVWNFSALGSFDRFS